MPQEPPENAPDERGVVEIVEAIIDDTRDLVGAHVDALREDMTTRFASLGATLTSTLLAFSITIVTALLAGIAVAMTLIALGLPAWAAFWIVTAAAAGLGVGLVRRALRKARDTGQAAGHAAERVKDDVAWISDEASRPAPERLADTAGAPD
jgi:hypothetical protein